MYMMRTKDDKSMLGLYSNIKLHRVDRPMIAETLDMGRGFMMVVVSFTCSSNRVNGRHRADYLQTSFNLRHLRTMGIDRLRPTIRVPATISNEKNLLHSRHSHNLVSQVADHMFNPLTLVKRNIRRKQHIWTTSP